MLVAFDNHSPFAGFELYAHMHWPSDAVARTDFLVTTAAQIMQTVEERVPTQLLAAVEDLLDRQGVSLDQVLAPGSRDGEGWQFAAVAEALNEEVQQKMFRPAGGYGAVAAAPGKIAIQRSARDNGRKYGAACGEMLVYVVSMHSHHPDISPSLNRATYLMVQRAKHEGRDIPAERDRKTMWTDWRSVAPLWAAMALTETQDKAWGRTPRNMHDPTMRLDLLRTSAWLIDFAHDFKPKGSRTALLPLDEGLTFDCDVPAKEPEIPPLTAEQIKWASAYKAPQPAQ